MGCTPSQSSLIQNFSKSGPGSFRKGRTLRPQLERIESPVETQSEDGGGTTSPCETDGEAWDRGGGTPNPPRQRRPILPETASLKPERKSSLPEAANSESICPQKIGMQEIQIDIAQVDNEKKEGMEQQEEKLTKKGGQRKQRKGKTGKQGKRIKERRASQEQKVDFPELLVKAHQSAYAYLNPSISRYEALMGLLDQATQTQIQLQQMVSFLALRYEEVNKALEEIASDGEKLLKESGEHLAWSLGKGGALRTEPPPDLLQQLLQYSVQKMQLVGGAVGGVTDSALEEAVDYFGAASDLMAEKLKVKRGLDGRLARVLGRIEAAAVRKPGPEDMTLYSEDSGLGGESESLAGSERHQQCREICDSASVENNKASASLPPPAVPSDAEASKAPKDIKMCASFSLNSLDSNCSTLVASLDEEDDDDLEDLEDEDDLKKQGTNSSPVDPCTLIRLAPKRIENPENEEMSLKMKDAISGRIRFVPGKRNDNCSNGSAGSSAPQWPEEEERKGKRPQTAAAVNRGEKKVGAAKKRRSRSAESLRSQGEDPTLLELQRTQKDLNRRLEKMLEGKTANDKSAKSKLGGDQPLVSASSNNRLRSSLDKNFSILPSQDRPVLQKSGSGEHGEEKKKQKRGGRGPLKATPPNTPLPKNERQSVKRLIDTFSQVEENINNRDPLKPLAPLKGVRKCGVPILPSMGYWGLAPINSRVDVGDLEAEEEGTKPGDIDLDSLPPPPPEVLMDNSFQITDGPPAPSDTFTPSTNISGTRGRSSNPQRTSVSQRLKASLNAVNVLPSKGSLRRGSVSVSPQRPGRQNAASRSSSVESQPEIEPDPEKEEAASLYRQARKIIHLQHSTESPSDVSLHHGSSTEKGQTRTDSNISTRKACPSLGATEALPGPPSLPPRPPSPPAPSRTAPPTPPPLSGTRKLPTTPSSHPTQHRRLPSPPIQRRQPSTPLSSPPTTQKQPSPPTQRKLPSPPSLRRQSDPASQGSCQGKIASPPAYRRDFSPSSYCKTPSPPSSPRAAHNRPPQARNSNDLGDKQPPSAHYLGNVQSIFCPASSSLFEAQPPVPQFYPPPSSCILPRPWGEQAARSSATLSAVRQSPQPFVRRSYSDRRPGIRLRLPFSPVSSSSSGSEPAICSQGPVEGLGKEEEPWNSQHLSELRSGTRSASHPELCIVGQSLQKD
ncbi:photoreceptor cilium actin regulator-like [Acipenser ruthenus]|uniref:photoreceptor cilium actin regulator-like n=1 Tax=Acipenser ruthenus TaxID=7906 RepID=UPI00145B3BEE|nr:photoreceptor cilium actin regulator-like [Acipenser ruthenus]